MTAGLGEGRGSAGASVPVCPRHPDRESYVRCQRCERPVCPECQRPAPVGVQCVDCVREGARGQRVARTVFGGRVGTRRPVVTQSIIGICVAVFALQWFGGAAFTNRFSFFAPWALTEPWRFLTSAFLHSPGFILHIAFNMYALWIIGPYLEALLGWGRFAALYLVSGFGGSVGYFVLVPASAEPNSGWLTPALGASGAIFGLFAALLVVNRRLGRDSSGVVGVILINVVLGFMPGLHIAWQAHFGGLLTGAALALVLAKAQQERRPRVQVLGVVAVVGVLVALVAWKASTVPPDLLLR